MWLILTLVLVLTWCGPAELSSSVNITAPVLPKRFRLSLESINPFTERGRFIKTYYDLENNLYRVNLDARGTEPPVVGKGPVVDIRNFTSGVAYRYNVRNNKCAKYPAPSCTARLIRTTNVNNWRISTPCGVLGLYRDQGVAKVYAGNQTVRNAPCDVWTSTRTNWPENRPGELKFKWFFLRKPWQYNNQYQIPLRLEVDGQVQWNATLNATIAFRISFFAFETNYWSEEFFSVPGFCTSSGGGEVSPSEEMYSRKHVIRVAALTAVVCLVVSAAACALYSCVKSRNSKTRLY